MEKVYFSKTLVSTYEDSGFWTLSIVQYFLKKVSETEYFPVIEASSF